MLHELVTHYAQTMIAELREADPERGGPRYVERELAAYIAPAQVYAKLLEDVEYMCSTRTVYRVLADARQVRERRAQRRHPGYKKPQLVAAPNQVWSWDTTKLPGPTKGTYFTLSRIR